MVKPFALATALFALAAPFTQVAAETPGTLALKEWFADLVPFIFPNTTTGWHVLFEDGTIPENITASLNANVFNNRAEWRAHWQNTANLITSRNKIYDLTLVSASAFATDPEGKNGWIVSTGTSTLVTKQGQYFEGGQAGSWVEVKWDPTLNKRTIAGWIEISTPPNFPNYPWN